MSYTHEYRKLILEIKNDAVDINMVASSIDFTRKGFFTSITISN